MGFAEVAHLALFIPSFMDIVLAKSLFVELKGDAKFVGRLVNGFQVGKWRQFVG